MRALKIGIGEGWRFVGVVHDAKPKPAPIFDGPPRARAPIVEVALAAAPAIVDPDALEAGGFDVFVNVYGRVFTRDPDTPAPLAPPQASVKQAAHTFEGLFR